MNNMPLDKLTKLKKLEDLLKLKKIGGKDIDLLFFNKLNDITDKINEILDIKTEIKGLQNNVIDLSKILQLVKWKQGERGKKGDSIKGDKGDKPTDKELKKLIKPLIPIPIKGDKGEDGEGGEKGQDGKDIDEEVIIKNVLEQIPQPEEKELEIDDVEGLEDRLKKLEEKPLGRSGGGVSKIAIDLYILDPYTPTGNVDGINKDFLLKGTPSPSASLKVYLDGQLQSLITDYTVSAKTITFVDAPITDTTILAEHRV